MESRTAKNQGDKVRECGCNAEEGELVWVSYESRLAACGQVFRTPKKVTSRQASSITRTEFFPGSTARTLVIELRSNKFERVEK